MKNVSRMLGVTALCAAAVMNIAGAANAGAVQVDDAHRQTAAYTTRAAAATLTDGGAPSGELTEARPVLMRYDEETGKTLYSLDDGESWVELEFGDAVHFDAEIEGEDGTVNFDAEGEDGAVFCTVTAAPAVAAE